MKIKKIFILSMILIFILSIFIIIFYKHNNKSMDYEEFLDNAFYYAIIKDEYLQYAGYTELENIISDEINYSINDLVKNAEAILVITMDTNTVFYGKGLINNCKIKKIIKGKNFNINDVIKIYDSLYYWRWFSGHYLGGSTPLKMNEDYIVFIKNASRPNLKNTYIYSSIPYGHIKISKDIKILKDYENASLKLRDIINYQYVFLKDTDKEIIELYENNCNNILEYFELK